MLTFQNAVTLHICARSDAERQRWVNVFQRLMGCFNQTVSTGGWVGPKVVETEPDVKLTLWLDDDGWPKLARLLRYFRWYQAAAQQEAVSIETVNQGQWKAWVVFEGDWQELTESLRQVFDPEYREAQEVERLLEFFHVR
jgi:hypothetical protein